MNGLSPAAATIPEGLYTIMSEYGCPSSPWCEATLSWDHASPHARATVERGDLVYWYVSRIPDQSPYYIIASTWGCPMEPLCWAELTWDRASPHPLATLEFGDRVYWDITQVPGKATYTVRSTWGCPSDPLCNAPLSWDKQSPHPRASLRFDKPVEWKFIPEVE